MAVNAQSEVWGGLALRGILTVLFGIAAVFWPGLTLVTLLYLFSAFVLANGLITLVLGLTGASDENSTLLGRILTVVIAVLEIGVGVYLLRHASTSFETLILLIGFILIIRGVVDFFGGLFEDASATYKTLSIVAGIGAVLAGVVILLQPVSAGVAFVWILGLYALITGPLMIALAMDMKKQLR